MTPTRRPGASPPPSSLFSGNYWPYLNLTFTHRPSSENGRQDGVRPPRSPEKLPFFFSGMIKRIGAALLTALGFSPAPSSRPFPTPLIYFLDRFFRGPFRLNLGFAPHLGVSSPFFLFVVFPALLDAQSLGALLLGCFVIPRGSFLSISICCLVFIFVS